VLGEPFHDAAEQPASFNLPDCSFVERVNDLFVAPTSCQLVVELFRRWRTRVWRFGKDKKPDEQVKRVGMGM
jgi:hypothetical protein